MKTTQPIIIAIPGEKRNGKMVKDFLLQNGLVQENDMNLEIINSTKLGVQLIQMRSSDALSCIQAYSWKERTIDLVITGMDQMREKMSGRENFESDSLIGFSYIETNADSNPLEETAQEYSIPFVLDSEKPTNIQLLVREEDRGNYMNLQSLRNLSGTIVTPYPTLVRKILNTYLVNIKMVSGKTEAIVRAGFGTVGIDVVDTGETAKRNGLIPTNVLFESYPAGILSASQLERDKRLQDIVRILTDASNNAYYSSSKYRNRYPRG